MSYSVQTLKNDVLAALHNTTENQIVNFDGVIDRAGRRVLTDLDPQETKRTLEFTTPIFNSVFDYPIASDVKGNKLIDIFPQVQRLPRDVWTQAYNQAFDVAKQAAFGLFNMFTMNFNSGFKSIRINAPFLNAPTVIDTLSGISINGTWATGGTASSLSVNNTNFVQSAGSLQFNTTTGAGYLENSTLAAVDLSTVINQSYLFVWVYIPTGTSLTSVNLRWGSSSSNYYTSTASLNQEGNAFVNGWNLCQFVWSGATTVGSPNPASISYARVTLNTTASLTGCLVNYLNSTLGSILSYEYYSKFLFRDAITGAFLETVTDDSNLVNLDTDSYNILFNLTTYYAAQQVQGLDAAFFDANFFKTEYVDAVASYKAAYKSEVQKPQSTYYSMPNQSYNRYGRPYNY